MRRNTIWMAGFLVMAGSLGFAGLTQAQEPVLNVQPPAAAPLLEAVTVPAATNAVPAPSPEPQAVTNAPATVEVPAVTNAPATVEVPAVTNAPVVPVITNVPAEVAVAEEPGQAWKDSSWQVGTRYTEVKLQDKTRGTPGNGSYFGTITEITEEQDGLPNKAYVQYRLFKSPVWLGVSYDHLSAKTQDNVDIDGDGIYDLKGSDGSEEIQGLIPYLQAAWDNKTRFSPYVQAGIGFYQAKFKPNSWGDNHQRYVEATGNVTGFELAGGLNIRLYKNLSADLFAKTMKVEDITGDWYFNYGRNYGGPFIMTMSYTAFGAGLNYRF
jgi:hypothetical protein